MLRVDPRNPGPLWGLANIDIRRRRFASARTLLERGLREASRRRMFSFLKPGLISALAKACAELDDLPKAEQLLQAYIRRRPFDGESRALLGRVCERQGKPAKAVVAYQDALRLGYEDTEVLLALAELGRRLRIDIMGFVELKARIFLKNMACACVGRGLKNGRQAAIIRCQRFKKALSRLGLSFRGEK